MKISRLWFFFALLSTTGSPLAEKTSTQLLEHLQVKEGFGGEFQQSKQLVGVPFPLVSKGIFEHTREEGLIWRTSQPIESTMNIKETGVWTADQKHLKGSELVGTLMLALVSGSLSELENYFDIVISEHAASEESTEKSTEKPTWHVELSPKGDVLGSVFKKIELGGTEFIEAVSLIETNGSQTDIEFSNQSFIGS